MKFRFRLGRSCYREAVSTLHCTLLNGSDVHVNERQKPRHNHARSTEEEQERRRMPNRDFLLREAQCKLRYLITYKLSLLLYTHSIYWKSAVEYDGGVLNA